MSSGAFFLTITDPEPVTRSYVKSSKEEINKVASLFQADSQKMKLLSILDEQVELLVKTGQPDLSRFFESLESHAITTSKEVSSLRAKYGQERVSKFLVWSLYT